METSFNISSFPSLTTLKVQVAILNYYHARTQVDGDQQIQITRRCTNQPVITRARSRIRIGEQPTTADLSVPIEFIWNFNKYLTTKQVFNFRSVAEQLDGTDGISVDKTNLNDIVMLKSGKNGMNCNTAQEFLQFKLLKNGVDETAKLDQTDLASKIVSLSGSNSAFKWGLHTLQIT